MAAEREDDVVSEEEEEEEENGSDAGEEKSKGFEDIRNADVVTKYRLAADIVNDAINQIVKAAVPGARVYDLCVLGDRVITEATGKIYKDKKITKGIGFPTCISVNHIVGSFSPVASDESKLKAGDMVKIDLGCHIDGYLSLGAHTVVLPNEAGDKVVTGTKADVLAAAFTAAECAIRMLKPGVKNTAVTSMIAKVAKTFHVNAVEGVFSHEVKRFEIDGEKVVANAIPETPLTGENKTKEVEFGVHEVWGLDIVLSTGTGRPQQGDERNTTVFKRAVEQSYKLKMKASRGVFSEITKNFQTFPFSMRQLEFDEKKARFGLVNCVQHQLLEPYQVLTERDGQFVAHVKFTALLLPNGTMKITGGPWDMSSVKSEFKVEDAELKEILALPVASKSKKKKAAKKKNKKKKAPAAAAAATAAPAAAAAAAAH